MQLHYIYAIFTIFAANTFFAKIPIVCRHWSHSLSPLLTHSWHACDNDYRHAMITDYDDDDNNVVRGYYTTALHSWWGRGHHRRYSMFIGPKTTDDDRPTTSYIENVKAANVVDK